MPARSDRQPPLAPAPLRLPLALREFLREETTGGAALVVAAVVALIWANSPWQGGYDRLWATELSLRLGRFALSENLHRWVTDGLMTVFFLVVGLEIKREVVAGAAAPGGRRGAWRAIALPAVAAIGGMALPAVIYAGFNLHRPGAPGWGIPMATDVAFALAVLALLGPRVPAGLKVFLLTLAVVDDLGSVLVVAGYYHRGVQPVALLAAVAVVAAVWVFGRVGVWWLPVHVLLGALLWLALRKAGISPPLAGVAMGLLAPARPTTTPRQVRERVLRGSSLLALHTSDGTSGEGDGQGGGPGRAARLREVLREARGTVPLAERLAHDLHPFSAFVAVPLFALANAGVHLSHGVLVGAGSGPVLAGILAGRLLGKPLGITAAAWLAVRAGIAALPEGATWRQLSGVGVVAGVGFTVPLFVADLAFPAGRFAAAVRLGLLLATVAAGIGGALLLALGRPGGASPPGSRAPGRA